MTKPIISFLFLVSLFFGACVMPHGQATVSGGDGGLQLGGDIGLHIGAGGSQSGGGPGGGGGR